MASTVLIGTYADGIYRADVDVRRGVVSGVRLAARAAAPSYLAFHPSGRWLFAVNEVDDFAHDGPDGSRDSEGEGGGAGSITTFAVQADGGLVEISQTPTGAGPCHLSVDRTGRFVFVACYTGASVGVYALEPNGVLRACGSVRHQGQGMHPSQTAPHPHFAAQGPVGADVYVADLGIDRLLVYQLDEDTGTLSPSRTPALAAAAGSGPRHLAFHPTGNTLYAVHELTSALATYARAPESGIFRLAETTSTLPVDHARESYAGAIRLHPNAGFLAVTNRGHDTLAVFTLDPVTARPTLHHHVGTQGAHPRDLQFDPSGHLLLVANQHSSTLTPFHVSTATAALTPTTAPIPVPSPACIAFSPVCP
jgi:6-phosphogluconolactonase